MITIKFINRKSGLPLKGGSIFIVFTDTVFGWFMPSPTDDEGGVMVPTGPGQARIYLGGELLGSKWLAANTVIYLENGAIAPSVKESDIILEKTKSLVPTEFTEQANSMEESERERGRGELVRA